VLKKISMNRAVLFLCTRTTAAASPYPCVMIDNINAGKTDHIITIRGPDRISAQDKKVNRQPKRSGNDTESFSKALRAAMRQDPDVILGRRNERFRIHPDGPDSCGDRTLVLSTLHTIDSTETYQQNHISLSPYQHKQVRMQLASVLRPSSRCDLFQKWMEKAGCCC